MDIFALLFAAVAAALAICSAGAESNRSLWREIRPAHWVAYGLLGVATVSVSLFHFSAIDNHAWRAHEDALWFAFRGDADSDGISDSDDPDIDGDGQPNASDPLNDSYNPLEVQPLIRQIFRFVGIVVGAQPESQVPGRWSRSSWDELKYPFMITALFLGMWGAVFAGMAGQLLTRRAWVGLGVAAVLVLYPTLAYWRVNAFHVASTHTMFAATLLAAVLAARNPTRLNLSTWFVLGSLCLYLRSEQAGSVAATAAIPLLCSDVGGLKLLRRWRDWVPGLVLGALLLVPATLGTMRSVRLGNKTEDYRTGWRFAKIHLGIPEVWEPMVWPGALALACLGLLVAILPSTRIPSELRRAARALSVIAVLGILPALYFISFGSRHLLNSGTATILLCFVGLAAIHSAAVAEGRRLSAVILTVLVGAATLGPTAVQCWQKLQAWDVRYFIREASPPRLPDTPLPTGDPQFNPVECASYAEEGQLCNAEVWPECHPPKDLRDPLLVKARWERFDGCVVWAVDETDREVAGVRHEAWMVVKHLYRWEPLGVINYEEGGQNKQVHVYRMSEEP